MQRFEFKVELNYEVQHEPYINVLQFGDGYSQRMPKGLNNDLCKYNNLRVFCNHEVAESIKNFLKEHNGYKSFLWRDVSRNRDVKVYCPSWSYRKNGSIFEFTFNFIEVK